MIGRVQWLPMHGSHEGVEKRSPKCGDSSIEPKIPYKSRKRQDEKYKLLKVWTSGALDYRICYNFLRNLTKVLEPGSILDRNTFPNQSEKNGTLYKTNHHMKQEGLLWKVFLS